MQKSSNIRRFFDFEGPVRVLIVDDVERNLKLLEAYLSTEDVVVEFAHDGIEALEKVAWFYPDIILLDVGMPRMDGFEVCRRLKADESTFFIPVIIITALEQSERIKGLDAGADEFLTKPVNRNELLVRMRGLLKLKKMHDKVVHYQEALESLFELSTFSDEFQDESDLFRALSERVALLLNIGTVLVVLQDEQLHTYTIKGGVGIPEGLKNTVFVAGTGAIGEVIKTGKPLIVRSDDIERRAHFNLDTGFVGVPLKAHDGSIIGALVALGVVSNIDDEAIRILSILSYRLASEIQIRSYSHYLEDTVEKRTADLRRAFRSLERTNTELIEAQEEMIFRLSLAAEFRDEDTSAHLRRISGYSEIISRELGLDEAFIRLVKISSIMHDIGKIGIPDSILLKRGRLTQQEFAEMKRHTLIGAKILSGSTSELLRMSERVALYHHERFDGRGYPYGLVGEDIPLECRIVAIADVFDALTTERPYKPVYKVERALEIIKAERGAHFDPDVADAFFNKLGSILALRRKYADEPEINPYQVTR